METKKIVVGSATLYLGDCLSVLPKLGPVDAVITDPPYNSGGTSSSSKKQDPLKKYINSDSNSKMLPTFAGDFRDQRSFHFWAMLWASAALSITKPNGVAVFFSDWRQLPVSTDYLQSGGWVWRGIVPWAKPSFRPQLGRFGAQCEYALWGSKGELPLRRGVKCLPGFFQQSSPANKQHITQKPVEVMEEIMRIVPPGSTVLDPFMGSGTTGVAALRAGHKFIGIEMSPDYFDIACKRLKALKTSDVQAQTT
jgi:site-specific DNA-methyltransferase (adenine-specific)